MKPTLLIISATIRRDLHRPFRRFKKFKTVHAYMNASYGDMDKSDLGSGTIEYQDSTKLKQILEAVKPDLIQGPEPVASRAMLKMSEVVLNWHKKTSTPYFFPMFENLPFRHKFGPIIGWIMGLILKRYAKSASWIYVLNEGAKKTLLALGVKADKIYRVNWGNWGIDRTEFRPQNQSRSSTPIILFVGRISQAKGVDILLAAFEKVKKEISKAELWLVGPTDLDKDNHLLILRAKTIKGVKLMGSKKQRELPAIFRKAWMSVLLSRTTKKWAEQVGMTALQSLACGTPVIAADSGSIREYLELRSKNQEVRSKENTKNQPIPRPSLLITQTNNGSILVPEGDVEATTKAIIQILKNPNLRERMGKQGIDWIKRTFDEAINVPKLEEETYKRFYALNKK